MPRRRPTALDRVARAARAARATARMPRPRPGTARGGRLLAAVLVVAAAGGAAAGGWSPYQIRPGDSLSALAARHGTTVERIRTMNGLPDDDLRAGDVLYLPGSHSVPAADPTSGLPAAVAPTPLPASPLPATPLPATPLPATPLPASAPLPVAPVVPLGAADPAAAAAARARTQWAIRAEAARQGVDPALALAVASVESGFDPTAVSSAGAVGVMQLMPRTASWIGARIGRPIDRLNEADNIAAGVAFLRFLLTQTSGQVTIAVGGYYQGLDSVQRSGFLPDTAVYAGKVLARRAYFAKAIES